MKIKKLTKLGKRQKWKELSNVGEQTAIQAIDASIGNGWTGIFPDKVNRPNKGATPDSPQDEFGDLA
jgi:hypothetical protein